MSEKEPNLKPIRKANVLELSEGMIPVIAGHLKDFKTDNDIPAAAYIATLPEGVDSAAAAAVHRHDTVFLASSAKTAQDASVAFMAKKENKGVDRVSTEFDMTGGMTAKHVVNRSVDRREMVDGEGKVIAEASTVYGATTSKIKIPITGAKELLQRSMEDNAKLLK